MWGRNTGEYPSWSTKVSEVAESEEFRVVEVKSSRPVLTVNRLCQQKYLQITPLSVLRGWCPRIILRRYPPFKQGWTYNAACPHTMGLHWSEIDSTALFQNPRRGRKTYRPTRGPSREGDTYGFVLRIGEIPPDTEERSVRDRNGTEDLPMCRRGPGV